MSTPGLIFIIGGIISAIIAGYWFYNVNKSEEEQQVTLMDLYPFVIVIFFAFLFSWAGVLASIFIKYGDVVIIKRKKKGGKDE